MTIVAGVDGCRAGWLMVRRDLSSGAAEVVVEARWADLPAADIVAVDMPIGLPESGARGCDLLARAKLGARRNSVFLHLRRPLLAFAGYAAANAWAKADGAGISKQAWNILPAIGEIDRSITPAEQDRVRETHPELVFARLNGGPLAAAKRTPAGAAERRALLEAEGFDRLDGWLAALKPSEAKADDLFDAAALSGCAARMLDGRAEPLPPEAPRDARGLKMEIWW